MEYLGPRHVCLGLGSTCVYLRELSKSDVPWKVFWLSRCLCQTDDDDDDDGQDDDDKVNVHKAAFLFRHAIHDMGLGGIFEQPTSPPGMEQTDTTSSTEKHKLYSAYVQQHCMMKLTNLRLDTRGELRKVLCTQTWPGQLSSLNENNGQNEVNTVTCLNPAEVWCDECSAARCGTQGCLRCYRFLPRDYRFSANGMSSQCSERSYELLTFVKCAWCSVSYCNKHAGKQWRRCDECKVSSCPECVSQLFIGSSDLNECTIVSGGRACGRFLCKGCTWYVGKQTTGNQRIVAQKGLNGGDDVPLKETEACCSLCRGQVQRRMEEFTMMLDSFGGFLP